LLAVQVGRRSGRQEDGEVRQQPDATHGVERKQLRKHFQLKLKTKKNPQGQSAQTIEKQFVIIVCIVVLQLLISSVSTMKMNQSGEAGSDGGIGNDKSSPKDAQVMASILKDMGIMEYEPRVINQVDQQSCFAFDNLFH
jgi:hypothetical protein